MKKYLTPLNIPEQKIGNYEIRREVAPPGKTFPLGTCRTVMFGQTGTKKLSWKDETVWHHLLNNGDRIMSDWPIEQKQHNDLLRGYRGHVLVGGLGLGYAVTVLTRRKAVISITVVEISSEVIQLVQPFTKDPVHKLTVVHANLFDYLKSYEGPLFDRAFYDIWSSDGEGTFHNTVVPLYQLSKGKVKRMPDNWNEDVMRGQLLMCLRNQLMFSNLKEEEADRIGYKPKFQQWEHDGTDQPWHNWCVPFWQWVKWKQPSEKEARLGVQIYAQLYGKWPDMENTKGRHDDAT